MEFSRNPLDVAVLRSRLVHPEAGGVVLFEGRVRNSHLGQSVLFLEYEAYEVLAEREMALIVEEIRHGCEVLEILCAHRLGRVDPGMVGVWIGVTAVHRSPAFQACALAIDAIKHRLPIWKKEHYADGRALWISCSGEADRGISEETRPGRMHDLAG